MSSTPSISSYQVDGVEFVRLQRRDASGEVVQSFEFPPDQLSLQDKFSYLKGLMHTMDVRTSQI